MKKYYQILFFIGFYPIVFLFSSCEEKYEYGCECESDRVANSEVIVTPSNSEISFSTYSYSGELNADAACHADMTLEFRWVDPVPATGEKRPPLSYEFQSLFGWFPTNEGMETHYYESGVIVWKISISDAIDKSKPEGDSYGIRLNWAGTGNENEEERKGIKCKIHIGYKMFDNDAYSQGCGGV